ncbi:Ferredoxin [Cronobacter sakazakii 680]|nr:Ferredoxin [Cronobacter sakazakii 680]
MSGTNQKQSRCVALQGTPGEAVRCTIYENRPSPCREFAMSGEGGVENEACNRARARYGLPPLPDNSLPEAALYSPATAPSSRVQSSAE